MIKHILKSCPASSFTFHSKDERFSANKSENENDKKEFNYCKRQIEKINKETIKTINKINELSGFLGINIWS